MTTVEISLQLAAFRSLPKFEEDIASFYTGMRPLHDREVAETQLNNLIDRLMEAPDDGPTKPFVLARFAETLSLFPGGDTEDRERLCGYLEHIMDMFGIESSDGLLNGWLYGADFGG